MRQERPFQGQTPCRIFHKVARLLISVLALLICNRARSLASGLAGSLAFAAATLGSAFLQVSLVQSLDLLHKEKPPFLNDIRF